MLTSVNAVWLTIGLVNLVAVALNRDLMHVEKSDGHRFRIFLHLVPLWPLPAVGTGKIRDPLIIIVKYDHLLWNDLL